MHGKNTIEITSDFQTSFAAGKLLAPPLQLGRIAAQRIGFGEKPDDAAVGVGIDNGKRFGLGAIECQYRFLDRHAGQQNPLGIAQDVLDRAIGRNLGCVGVGHQHHAEVAALVIDSNNRGR